MAYHALSDGSIGSFAKAKSDTAMMHTVTVELDEYLCGGCSVASSSDGLAESRMAFFKEGFVLCDGVGDVPGGGRPMAELAVWECSRLLRAGLNAEDALIGAGRLVSRASLLVESGGTTVLVGKFCSDGSIEVCSAGDTLGFSVGKGAAKPIGGSGWGSNAVTECLGAARAGAPKRGTYGASRVRVSPGEWLCLMTGGAWRSVPLMSMSSICRDCVGAPQDAARYLAEAAKCYGVHGDVAVAVIERVVRVSSKRDRKALQRSGVRLRRAVVE